MKKCSNCKEEKDYSEFVKCKSNKDGFQYACKSCRKVYRENSKEDSKIYQKEYRIKNKDKLFEKAKIYRKKNSEKIKEYMSDYRLNNKESIQEVVKSYSLKNRERFNAYRNEYVRRRKKYDPEFKKRVNTIRSNRINLKKSKDKTKSSSSKIIELFDIQDYECIYCKVDISESNHIEHINPLSKGGSNLIINLALACPNCNLRKHNKNLDVWLKEINSDYIKFTIDLENRNLTYFPDELAKFYQQQNERFEPLNSSNQEFIQQCLSNYLEKLNEEN